MRWAADIGCEACPPNSDHRQVGGRLRKAGAFEQFAAAESEKCAGGYETDADDHEDEFGGRGSARNRRGSHAIRQEPGKHTHGDGQQAGGANHQIRHGDIRHETASDYDDRPLQCESGFPIRSEHFPGDARG